MTRKHFTAIAMMLRMHAIEGYYLDAKHFLDAVSDWADMLSEENPRFNREVFVNTATADVKREGW